jgi:predicted transcriptional regulator
MDLLKMNPMARKLTVHTDAFNKALESSDPFAAQQHLNEILKFAGFLNDDIHSAIKKSQMKAVLDSILHKEVTYYREQLFQVV